jgi:diguanylate cyclase (GGDEF)-like protein
LNQYLKGETPNLYAEVYMKADAEQGRWYSIHAKAIWKDDKPIRMSGCFMDITEKMENLQKIENLAYCDLLTGLSNRTGFYKTVSEIQSEAAATNSKYALFFIDLDNFKDLNDAFGHEFGDQVLIQAAQRYKIQCGNNIRIARLGGDEFIMILHPASDDSIHNTVDKLLKLNNEKLYIQGKDIYLSASIGVAVYPDHARDYEDLIRFADIAMYTAKKEGKMRYKVFDSSWFHLLKDKVKLSEDIRIALEEKQFVVYYQPEIDAATGDIMYVEALIRWKHPDKGMISPMDFIPLAEETGKIPLIGFYVLKEILNFKNRLKDIGYEKLPVSINVSVKQIIEKNFIDQFTEMVKEAGIEPSQLIIEITESIFVESFEDIIDKLNQLKEKGFSIALDDFGTGYSSLSYLMRLPIQTVKIDKCFIDGVITNNISRSLIISIIEIAHNLGLKVVAEGVERKEQMDFLTGHGCDYIQGYYYSRPLP